MLDHMLFNLKKWFNVGDNADKVMANGRTYYALPSKVTVSAGQEILENSNEIASRVPLYDATLNVRGFVNSTENSDSYYIAHGKVIVQSSADPLKTITLNDASYDVKPNQIKKVIWGGKKDLLSALYQGFKSLPRMEVA